MGLLNPILLLLAGAAAVPLLLHLLQRHQGPRVPFPALRYLRRAEKESARRIRLRQILLMLLRIAAVVLLALAAARPFVRAGGTGHSPTAVVIVLDNSMSTGAVEGEVRVLDELKERALEMLAAAGPDDRFWLLRAGNPGEPALAGDAAATALRVRETEPSGSSADIPAALAHARGILATGAESRAAEIHLLTDLQATSFAGGGSAEAGGPPVIVWHPGTDAPPNRAIAAVEVGGGLAPVSGQRTTVTATLNGNSGDAEPVNVRLSIDDRLMAAASARAGQTAVLALPERAEGFISGSIAIDADALHADDERWFVARVLPPPRVAVAGAQPFVEDALEVLIEAGRIQRSVTGADVAILDGAAGVEAFAGAAVVILPPLSPTELAAVNRRLAAAGIPWRYGAPLAGEARLSEAHGDPLLRGLTDARVRQLYPLERTATGGSDSVLVRTTDGSAWAVRGTRARGGTYLLLATPLSAEASTIPTSAVMLPLLDRITGGWSRAQPAATEVVPGQEIALPAGVQAVARPDGSRDDVAGSRTYRIGTDAGIYTVLHADSIIAAYAANAPADESDLARLDRDELEARLSGWTLHIATGVTDWRRATFRERLGRELWRPLLLALLAVLVVESIVAAAGRGRHSMAGVDTAGAERGTAIAEADPH